VLRAGGIAIEDLEIILGPLERAFAAGDRPLSPGQRPGHYATATPLDIVPDGDPPALGERVGLLAFVPPAQPERFVAVEVLSHRGDLREAAANLFSALHRLDKLALDRIVARPVPETGLGEAIMDRLRRCAAGSRQLC
jgi:L-threonylcarbamoyladenylate synthase